MKEEIAIDDKSYSNSQ